MILPHSLIVLFYVGIRLDGKFIRILVEGIAGDSGRAGYGAKIQIIISLCMILIRSTYHRNFAIQQCFQVFIRGRHNILNSLNVYQYPFLGGLVDRQICCISIGFS